MRGNRMGRNWLMKWDEVKKFPWYSHRLMHRKRMTCELHDSYFHLMTIKRHFKDRVGDWVVIELLYNSVKTEVKTAELEIEQSYRREVVRKATSGQKGLGALMSWGPGKLLIRCSKESYHPAEWASKPPVEHLENEKDTTLTAIRVGGQDIAVLFGLQLPLTHKPWVTLFEPLQIKREVYFDKEVFTHLFIIVSLWYCRWQYNTLIEIIKFDCKI